MWKEGMDIKPYRGLCIGILWWLLLLVATSSAQGPVTVTRAPMPTDPCAVHDQWIALGEVWVATDCTPGAAVWRRQSDLFQVRVASTSNVTLATPGATHDGITLAANDRVLLAGQSDPTENGLYLYSDATTLLTRTTDADLAAELIPGVIVSVQEGTVNGPALWMFKNATTPTLGTTPLTFVRTGGTGESAAIAIASLPTSGAHGSTRTVNDAADTDDATVGGANTVVDLYWDADAAAWTVKIQGSLQSLLTRGPFPGWNDLTLPLIIAPNGGAAAQIQYDNFGGGIRCRIVDGSGTAIGSCTFPLVLQKDSAWFMGYINALDGLTEIGRAGE